MAASTKTQPAAALEAHLGFWLRFVSNHVSLRFQQQLEAHDVSVTEWVALRTLFGRPECSHGDLIESLGMTKGAASKVITRLEEKGLAHRQLVDGRVRDQRLGLTSAGKALVPKLAALADANDEHFFGHLPIEQRVALMTMLQLLAKHHQFKEIPTA